MKNNKLYIFSLLLCSIALSIGCSKLQQGYNYKHSYYDTNLHMSVMDFMQSRPDLFSSMLAAINYVDQDPAYKDVKKMYSTDGNTFLLMTNTALSALDNSNSYWVLNPVMLPDSTNPNILVSQRGSDWSQYPRDTVANLLRYHVLKGIQTYSTLSSTPKWVETFAYNTTNDSAKVYIYLENVREANLRLNNYVGLPISYKGVAINWTLIAPRTPDLHATNGVVQVMDKFLFEPTLDAINHN